MINSAGIKFINIIFATDKGTARTIGKLLPSNVNIKTVLWKFEQDLRDDRDNIFVGFYASNVS